MSQNFQLGILQENNQKLVDFANNTGGFVEVVLEIDGQVIKGYCYPPFHHKPIRRSRSGEALPFSNTGRVRALVYSGVGNYKDDTDYEVPPLIRRKLNQMNQFSTDQILMERAKRKVIFHRTNSRPVEVLEIPY